MFSHHSWSRRGTRAARPTQRESAVRPQGFWMSVISRPPLKIETVPVDCETQSAIACGHRRDAGGGLVAGAQAVGQRLVELAARGQVAARGQDHPVAPDDERPVDRRELLDRLLQPRVEDVPLVLGIAVERVDHQLMALGEHAVAVADDEQRADRPALAALDAQLAGEGQDPLEDGRASRRSAAARPSAAENSSISVPMSSTMIVSIVPERSRPVRQSDPVAGLDQPLGGRDQDRHLDLTGPGHRRCRGPGRPRTARPTPPAP